ncbi:MAG: hypothetical protein A2Y73_04800 [Chloroflexi bacterium RBG_13_56_8]|nr:MAG: hypothetical protein A2Y73_04800 [Chloroflexi bacterium RBG_13_56_8]
MLSENSLPESETRKPSRGSLRSVLAWAAPALVLLAIFFLLDIPVIRSDGLAYYAWLHSIVHDRDISLDNEYRMLEEVNIYQLSIVPATGKVSTPFPFGSAILWIPFYRLGLWVGQTDWYALRIAPAVDLAAYLRLQGADFWAGLALTVGTNLMALASVYLAMDIARRHVSLLAASLAAISVFLGTPMIYYSTIEPTMSHVPAVFCITLVYWLFFRFGIYHRSEDRERPGIWLLIGLALGLATMVRWQLLLSGIPLGIVLLYQNRWRSLATFCLGVALLAWTIPWSWYHMFGKPLVVPANVDRPWAFLVGPQNLLKVWFSSRHGLFNWSPIVALGMLGALFACQRHPQTAFVLLGAFLVQSLISASVADWWAGWSFGMRRMVELYPLYVMGLALAWERIARPETFQPGRTSRIGKAVYSSAVGLSVVWSLFLFIVYASVSIHQGEGTSGEAVALLMQGDASVLLTIASRFKAWYGCLAWSAPPPWR